MPITESTGLSMPVRLVPGHELSWAEPSPAAVILSFSPL